MARFLYFVPCEAPASLDGLPDVHPRKVLAGTQCIFRGTTSGPAEEGGCIVMATEPDGAENQTAPGFYPEKQEWKQYPGWALGWEKGKLPGPADLLKADAVGGDLVKLGDKREWLLPLLGPAWQELPSILKVKPTGGCEVVLRDEFLPLCKESEWWFEIVKDMGGYKFDRFMKFACDALATNYHLGVFEASELGIITASPNDHLNILTIALGMNRIVAESKKNDPASG